MDDKISANITIAERRYPMKIKPEEEEKIRKAAKIINDRLLQYQQLYKGKDNQDFLAMTALQFAIQVIEMMEKNENDQLSNELRDLNEQLNLYLSKQ